MNKILFPLVATLISMQFTTAQILIPSTIKQKAIIPAPPPAYSLTSARVTITTGNDNKESPSNMIFFFREKDGIWGKGSDLFEGSSKTEFKINSTVELNLTKYPNTPQASYTLDNLQARGLYFAIYYNPNFFADAWKIVSFTVTLEFKDQYGNLHPSFGKWNIQYNIPNGLLTNSNWLLKATADGISFIPSVVTIGNKF